MQLALTKIVVDHRCQPRASLSTDAVLDYAEAMRTGAIFPALTVYSDGTTHWLADGFHRHAAAVSIGARDITCNVRPGKLRDAILHACSANAHHGLRRTDDDKRRAVNVLLADPEWAAWSDREIARRANVSHTFVAESRRSRTSLTGNAASENAPRTAAEGPARADVERTVRTKHGTVTTMDVSQIGRSAAGASSKERREDAEPAESRAERPSGSTAAPAARAQSSSANDDFRPTPPHAAIAILARGIADTGSSPEAIIASCPDAEACDDLLEACERAIAVLGGIARAMVRQAAA